MAETSSGKPPSSEARFVEPVPSSLNADDFVRIDAPYFSATSAQVSSTGTEITIVLNRLRPMMPKPGVTVAPGGQVAVNEAIAIVSLSTQIAKDLTVLLSDVIGQLEKEFGELQTPFLKSRAAARHGD